MDTADTVGSTAKMVTLLVLADGRLPTGGHAHSGGLEAACAAHRVAGPGELEQFLRGRLATVGLVAAGFAAAACREPDRWAELDEELDARTPSPALRKASRAQGRAMLRAGRALWTVAEGPDAAHHAVALGLVAKAAGLDPEHAALAAAYGSVTGPASAAIKLLSLDPYPVHALLARLADACEQTARRACAYPGLPAASAPLVDLDAEHHATWEVRLFAS
jgi:urease accessory protein